MASQQTEIDYAALVAADEAEASSDSTLEQVVRDNIEHFEGFARARAKQRRAVNTIAEITQRDPASIRRTFLKVYGRWDAFSRRVRGGGSQLPTAVQNAHSSPIDQAPEASKFWE